MTQRSPMESEHFLWKFLEVLPVPVFVMSEDQQIGFANDACCRLFGLPLDALIGRTLWEYWPDNEFGMFKSACRQVFDSHEGTTAEFGFEEDHSSMEVCLTWWDGYVAGAIIEVTKHKQVQALMADEIASAQNLAKELGRIIPEALDRANRDVLTGLNNRRRAEDLAQSVFTAMTTHGCDLSLIMFDLDHFKMFNDLYGHIEGDNVLRRVGAAVTAFIHESETAARIGGEEFIVICPNANAEKVRARAEGLLIAIRQIDGTAAPVTASFGVATFATGESDWHQTFLRADEALYAAKSRGRDQVAEWAADLTKKPNKTSAA